MHEENTPVDPDALLSLIPQIKENYQAPPPPRRRRGKQRDFSALAFLLLAVVAVGLRNVDTESAWSTSGSRGGGHGYRLVRQSLGWPAPVPLRAVWRPNNKNEAVIAAAALAEDHRPVTDVRLGDETFGGVAFIQQYAAAGGWMLTPKQLPAKYHPWQCDLYAYRKATIERLFPRLIQASGLKECQVKGRGRNGAFGLASVWLYQILFLVNYRQGRPAAAIKDLIDDARWRIST